ncbi:MAG: dienelactone hydrolase family protein, partial [Acidobacteria bacterium]|nr:dienelactone hydrolase family protein [Acidobacteriota bacterium]
MDETAKTHQIRQNVDLYRTGAITRRDLLRSLIAITGSYTAAHLFLESSGLAQSVISSREAEAANVAAEMVEYPSGDITVAAYLAKPKTAGKHPAILVIHENRGLNEHIRDVARRFAAEGFVALAPDLLSRAGGTAKMKTVQEAT